MDVRRIESRLHRISDHLDEMGSRIAELSPGAERGALLQLQSSLEMELARLDLVPTVPIMRKLTAMIDELAQSLGKRAQVVWSGWEAYEIESELRDRLQDSLIPALRNALDHGIEAPAERTAAGKKPDGELKISLWLQGARLYVEVADDGRGLSIPAMLAAQQKSGAKLNDDELNELFFAERASTRAEVTSISGRGIGLSGIRLAARARGGDAWLCNQPGHGLALLIEFPVNRVIVEATPALLSSGEPVWVHHPESLESELEFSSLLFRRTDPAFAQAGSAALQNALRKNGKIGVLSARALPRSPDLAPLVTPEEFKLLCVPHPK